MKTSLATVAAVGFKDLPPNELLPCYRELGCRSVQIYRNYAAGISDQEMMDVVAESGLPCDSIHGVYGDGFDPSALAEDQRQIAVGNFKAEGELALKLGGPLVVVHCSSKVEGNITDDERNRCAQQLKKSIRELGEFGRSIGVQYAFENLPGYHRIGSNVGELATMLAEVGAPNTGICFDTGHANMVCDPVQAISDADGRIVYVHYTDNGGKSDDHLMPTYGMLDNHAIARRLCKVGYRGTIMLEVFDSPERLRRLIDDGLADRLAEIIAIANGQTV